LVFAFTLRFLLSLSLPLFSLLQDRRQELVFIGQNLNQEALTAALDACLITRGDLKEGKDSQRDRKEVLSYLNEKGTKQVDEIVQVRFTSLFLFFAPLTPFSLPPIVRRSVMMRKVTRTLTTFPNGISLSVPAGAR